MFEAIDGELYFTAHWYYRANDTVSYLFWVNTKPASPFHSAVASSIEGYYTMKYAVKKGGIIMGLDVGTQKTGVVFYDILKP
jgi:hypothetical protein